MKAHTFRVKDKYRDLMDDGKEAATYSLKTGITPDRPECYVYLYLMEKYKDGFSVEEFKRAYDLYKIQRREGPLPEDW